MPRNWKKPELPAAWVCEELELTPAEIHARAMILLARREHSRLELQRKLIQRGIPGTAVLTQVLDQLATENLQSDLRFAEQYAYYRMMRGFGPLRIRAELRERGINGEQIQHAFDCCEAEWQTLAVQAREKRFGTSLPVDGKEYQRQTRFLQQRGFSHEHIRQTLKLTREDD